MIDGSMLVAGQLLAIAFACGLNLYATVALLGLASRVGILAELPPGMSGVENGIVIGIAIALFVVEFIVDRIPFVSAAWEAVHTLIRPVTAGLLAALALNGLPIEVQVGGAVAAAVLAFAAHASKAGVRLILSTRRAMHRRSARGRAMILALWSLLEDAVAITIVVATLLVPTAAAGIVAAFLALLVLTGPRLWRAASLGMRALLARVRGFFGSAGWRSRDQLPWAVRSVVPLEPLGRGPARAASAAVTGLPRVGAYRNGWLVLTCDGPRFVYRSMFGTQSATLPTATVVHLRAGLLADALDVRPIDNGRAFTLFLLKDGPPPQVAAAELTSVTV